MDGPLKKAIDIIVQVADPDKIILFGSRARGDNKKDSDYDICVIVQTPDKFDELKDDPYFVYRQIAKDGVTVYEKSMIGSERY